MTASTAVFSCVTRWPTVSPHQRPPMRQPRRQHCSSSTWLPAALACAALVRWWWSARDEAAVASKAPLRHGKPTSTRCRHRQQQRQQQHRRPPSAEHPLADAVLGDVCFTEDEVEALQAAAVDTSNPGALLQLSDGSDGSDGSSWLSAAYLDDSHLGLHASDSADALQDEALRGASLSVEQLRRLLPVQHHLGGGGWAHSYPPRLDEDSEAFDAAAAAGTAAAAGADAAAAARLSGADAGRTPSLDGALAASDLFDGYEPQFDFEPELDAWDFDPGCEPDWDDPGFDEGGLGDGGGGVDAADSKGAVW